MKIRKYLLLLILIGSSVQLASQVNPVSIDLRNNGVKLDAKFYVADKVISAPTVILLHGFPGNANSPYGLAERLNKNGMNILVFNYEGSFNSEGIFSWGNCFTLAAQYIRAGRGVTTLWLKYQVPARCSRLVTQPPHIAGPFVVIS